MPTFPGIHPNFEIDKYPNDVRQAIRRISDNFYVSRHFDPIKIGNSQYFGILARPTDEASVILNTQRELLILFTRYETFEIRTLEAYGKFYELLESARVDQSIRFLVSADVKIEYAIKHYLDQHPEYPIIIPVTFDQIHKRTDPLIRAVRSNYLIRDLFGFQSPLREEHYFFGRNDVVSAAIDTAKSGQHFSLFGLRKSGKTSTIYAIERRCRPSELSVVSLDCQDLAIHGRRFGQLLIYLVGKIRSQHSLKALTPPIEDTGPAVSEWFSRSMGLTLDTLRSNLLLIFDEIENISPVTAASNHWKTENDAIYFWQIIRAFCQTQKKRSLSICLVGTSPYLLEVAKFNGIDNPAYLLAAKRFIPNLTFEETKEMVERLGYFMGLNFPPQAVARLHQSYGGHPFFTRQICSKIHQLSSMNRPCDVPVNRVEQAQLDFNNQLDSYLSDIVLGLKEAYPDEYSMLKALSRGESDELNEYAAAAPDLIDHLIGYGLVVLRDRTYEIAFSSIDRAINKLEPAFNDKSNDERWSDVCIRRGNIEQAIRSNLRFWSKTVSVRDLEAIFENTLTNARRESLKSDDPAVIFSRGNSPLFLSDIGMLLKDERILPHLAGKRKELTSSVWYLNGMRKDAHANDITQEEYRVAMAHIELLEGEFSLD